MTACVFDHYARDKKVQKIIFATGLGTAAAHFESAKRMAANDRARARAVDVKVPGFEPGFYPLDVIRARSAPPVPGSLFSRKITIGW